MTSRSDLPPHQKRDWVFLLPQTLGFVIGIQVSRMQHVVWRGVVFGVAVGVAVMVATTVFLAVIWRWRGWPVPNLYAQRARRPRRC